jgi:protein-S-isoprenylcysteine O-methyltransferase Ste14
MSRSIHIPPTYFFLSLVVIITMYFVLPQYNLISFPYNLVGIVLVMKGISLAGKSRNLFKLNNTPHTFDEPQKLVSAGIYAKTRNPMYAGMLLFIVGIALCFQNILGFLAPLMFFLVVNTIFIPFEEKRMKKIFGDSYTKYRQKVRRWI